MTRVRYFFVIVFAVVASGVIYFVPPLAADGRWDVIAFFVSLLIHRVACVELVPTANLSANFAARNVVQGSAFLHHQKSFGGAMFGEMRPVLKALWDLENELRSAARNAIFMRGDDAKKHMDEAKRHYQAALDAMREQPRNGDVSKREID